MYSKAYFFRPSVTLAYNDIEQSDIRHRLITNTPPQAISYVRKKLKSGPKDICTKQIDFSLHFRINCHYLPVNRCKYG